MAQTHKGDDQVEPEKASDIPDGSGSNSGADDTDEDTASGGPAN